MFEEKLNHIFSIPVDPLIHLCHPEKTILFRQKVYIVNGKVIFKCYPVRADYSQPRIGKHGGSRTAQKDLNEKNRMEWFQLLFLNNFTLDDLFITLTFEIEPDDEKQAVERFKYFLKKLRKAATAEVKDLGVIESKNIQGDNVRIHFHVAISGVNYETVCESWIYGHVHKTNAYDIEGVEGYSENKIQGLPKGKHGYLRSKNLEAPEPEIKTLDYRHLDDADELDNIINCPRNYAEINYPEYELEAEPEIWHSSYMPGYYVKMEMKLASTGKNLREFRTNNLLTHLANVILGICPDDKKPAKRKKSAGKTDST